MILQAGFTDGAYVRFDDENSKGRIPTPEVIDHILRKVERAAARLNAGMIPEDAIPLELDTE